MNNTNYIQTVSDYYDAEASTFEERATSNPLLVELRKQFRNIVLEGNITTMLEIGYGPGLDMVWFSKLDNNSIVHGLDITPNFYKLVKSKSENNVKINPMLGGPEKILEYLKPNTIDTVYVFFGALNTCNDIDKSISQITECLKPGGRIVVTFVNKWYLFEIIWNIITFRPQKAFSRLRKIWGGYSPNRFLASKCYSSREIHKKFGRKLKRVFRKGFCIIHPAWYRQHWAPVNSLRSKLFFTLDNLLQWTPFWNSGEYSLYIYRKNN
ncbi:MAG: hypothetical protein CMB56_006330 [Methanobacteriota archaeon]|nr:MAG: hypothetical protein CMB56_006330 [Euryarchaeota archaeon]|tara:strand:+ start:1045 stop:1845 length:801 start_codon:yes stop_codon:yes gene_type:complete